MFARIYRIKDNKEVLINLEQISLFEVSYSMRDRNGDYHPVSLKDAAENPAAIRMFKFQVGGEDVVIAADNPKDPIKSALAEMYSGALKGQVERLHNGASTGTTALHSMG